WPAGVHRDQAAGHRFERPRLAGADGRHDQGCGVGLTTLALASLRARLAAPALRRAVRLAVPRPALLAWACFAVAVALIPLVYLAVRAGEAGWSRIVTE